MTTSRQFADSEGTFNAWTIHPDPCTRTLAYDQLGTHPVTAVPCGAVVHSRVWESSDGAYEDVQYRCANGHTWWIDGIDA